jgi:hypothetical protein
VGLKLRTVVTCAPTPDGMLLRMGERVLSIRGAGVYQSFQRLRARLDGAWTREQLLNAVPASTQAVLERLFDALAGARMIYASEEEDGCDQRVAERYASYVARIESVSSRPRSAFRNATDRTMLLAGPGGLTNALLEAALEAGFTRVSALDDRAVELRAQSGDGCDVAILAIDVEDEPAWIERARRVRAIAAQVVPIVVHAGRVLAGPFGERDRGGCAECLIAAYRRVTTTASTRPRSWRAGGGLGFAIAGRLLVQRWLDAAAGVMPAEDALLFYDIDLHTLEIRLRPLPPNPLCPGCRRGERVPTNSRVELLRPDVPERAGAEDVLAKVHKYLTDPITGLFQSIHEGGLLQLPHKQSAVRWRDPSDPRRQWWLSEVADSVRGARTAAVRSALEEYLRNLIHLGPGSVSPVLGLPAAHEAGGLVVSSYTWNDLRRSACYRAIAFDAQTRGSWQDVAFAGTARVHAELTMSHLHDSGHAVGLKVQRHLDWSREGIDVLRFLYDDEIVSVVAGAEDDATWAAGLKDVWLHVTAGGHVPSECTRSPAIRFRAAISDWSAGGSETLESRLGGIVQVAPLTVAAVRLVEPLLFGYAYLSPCPEPASVVWKQERAAASERGVLIVEADA